MQELNYVKEVEMDKKKMVTTGDLEFRVGTFREDIVSSEEDAYECDVIFYYVKDAYPRSYYYDNIDYKYNNTVETIAQHIAGGNAEVTLLELVDGMKLCEHIYLYGIDEPLCTKQTLIDRCDEIRREIDAEDAEIEKRIDEEENASN